MKITLLLFVVVIQLHSRFLAFVRIRLLTLFRSEYHKVINKKKCYKKFKNDKHTSISKL